MRVTYETGGRASRMSQVVKARCSCGKQVKRTISTSRRGSDGVAALEAAEAELLSHDVLCCDCRRKSIKEIPQVYFTAEDLKRKGELLAEAEELMRRISAVQEELGFLFSGKAVQATINGSSRRCKISKAWGIQCNGRTSLQLFVLSHDRRSYLQEEALLPENEVTLLTEDDQPLKGSKND